MFSYLSMLVETHIFDRIEANFLIVEHTHASIDQLFSGLSTVINNANFIGSPLALMNLFKSLKGESLKGHTISIAREISVYYDFKSAIKPYLNSKIMVRNNNIIIL